MKKKKLFKKITRSIIRSQIVTKAISSLIYYYALFVGKTSKWQLKGVKEFYQSWDKNKNIILIGWHGRALMFPYLWNKKHPLNALVSLHQDGRLIAGFLQKFGVGTIGGSTTENAKGAAVGLMRSLQDHNSICIIPDGPRGPRMRMTMSPIYYAQKSGKPIHCITYSFSKAKIIEKAWDKMMVPTPFSEGICIVSEPIFIPQDATSAELEAYRLKVENRLNEISFEADKTVGITPTVPADKQKQKRYKD